MTSKTYFITGAGRGVGSDLVTAALDAGHSVVATAREAAQITATVGEHARLLPLSMDVTDPAAIEKAVRKAIDRFQTIDVLITNAGRFYTGFFETMSPEDVRAQMEVNFFGALNVTRAILPIMRSQRRGHLVHVSAMLGIVSAPFVSVFSASKHALEGWGESLADEVAAFGVKTTIIEPGAFDTKTPEDRARSVFPNEDSVIEDYAESSKATTAAFKAFNGQEPGHRGKLALATITVIDMEQPPRRWVAGQDSVDGIVRQARELIAAAEAFPELSTTLAHDDRTPQGAR